MKSLVSLLEHLLVDSGRRCSAPYRRDILTMKRRVECEGDSFITITLPRFGQVLERALDQSRLSPTDFNGLFKKDSKVSCLPSFLKGFMSQVFDSTGSLLQEPNLDCILVMRQICYIAKKIERPCLNARLLNAEKQFLKCEEEVSNDLSGPLGDTYGKVSRIVMSEILHTDYYEELVPRHGPGTTAERIKGNQKYIHRRWHARLEGSFPFTEFGIGSINNLVESDVPFPDFPEPGTEQPVRVVFVPKTMKSPRVIAIEPVCMQYAQQSILHWLVPRVERGAITAGRINFSDQRVNQALALSSSSNGLLATIDMKEASDRVSMAMAETLYAVYPEFWELIDSCRSRRAKLPSGQEIDLKKFASMGSALCFPTEALVFFCMIVSSRILRAKIRVDRTSIHKLSRDVYVYGDDIIVPADEALAICADLESIGLKVNWHKSFWTGKFRESCGSDYYDSYEVTPVYLRRDLPTNRAETSEIISSISTANQLFDAGYPRTATAIKDAVERIIGKLPMVTSRTSAIGWTFNSEYVPPTRFNDDLQRIEYRCLVPVPRRSSDPLEGDSALVKCFRLVNNHHKTFDHDRDQSILPDPVTMSDKHLLESVGSGRLTLKVRWVPLS